MFTGTTGESGHGRNGLKVFANFSTGEANGLRPTSMLRPPLGDYECKWG